jgi:ankyrin repeat protein
MDGKVLLSLAAKKGFLQCAQLLLKKGKANVDLVDGNGNTPLLYAATENNMPLLTFLLQSKADVTVRNNNGWNALMTAAFYGHDPAVGCLSSLCGLDQDSYDGSTSLMLAATAGKLSVVETLILKGANVKVANRKGAVVYNFVPRPREVSQADLQSCILTSLATKARRIRVSFLLGGHRQLGAESSIQALLRHPLFDPETLRMIFSWAEVHVGCESSQLE